jgi:hypothetical protein
MTQIQIFFLWFYQVRRAMRFDLISGCINGPFNHLGGCMQSFFFLLLEVEWSTREVEHVFKCALVDCPTIWACVRRSFPFFFFFLLTGEWATKGQNMYKWIVQLFGWVYRKKNSSWEWGGGGCQEEWNLFLKCVLMNYPTIRMGEKKFSSSSSSWRWMGGTKGVKCVFKMCC